MSDPDANAVSATRILIRSQVVRERQRILALIEEEARLWPHDGVVRGVLLTVAARIEEEANATQTKEANIFPP